MELFLIAIRAHLSSQWSSQANFWAGVLGMLANNFMVLLGVWAMLFAGKDQLNDARDDFFIMNFVLMASWGVLHVFFGGIVSLDQQITRGGLDLSLVTPRPPLLILSLSQSFLPAWGDVILGGAGLVIMSFHIGFFFFLNAILMVILSLLALFSIYLLIGSLAFWFRRTETAFSVLVNMCLAFNTYPVFDGKLGGGRWILFVVPLLLVGAIPSFVLRQPTLGFFALEIGGVLSLFLVSLMVFQFGLRRFHSAAGLGLERV